MKGFPDIQSKGRMETKVETLLLQVCIVMVTELSRVYSDTCTNTSACSCIYSDGSTVDLSPLDSGGGTTPKFQDVQEVLGRDLFSWNPCTPFSEGDCSNIAVCQKRPTVPLSIYYPLGDQNSASFMNDDKGMLTLSYSAVEGGVRRTSYITLTCDQQTDGDLAVQGEKQQSAQYYMVLKSKYACPKASHHGGEDEKKGDLSAGSLICIVFFGLLAVYLAGGIVFQIFVRKESGRRIIPNISFWSNIPGLAKDGVHFIVRRSKGSNYTKI